MEIKLHKRVTISVGQQDYITSKIDHLKKLAKRGEDESSKAYIDIEYVQHDDPSEAIGMKVRLVTPGHTYHCEEFGTTVEEVIDKIEPKIRNQIEHSKK